MLLNNYIPIPGIRDIIFKKSEIYFKKIIPHPLLQKLAIYNNIYFKNLKFI